VGKCFIPTPLLNSEVNNVGRLRRSTPPVNTPAPGHGGDPPPDEGRVRGDTDVPLQAVPFLLFFLLSRARRTNLEDRFRARGPHKPRARFLRALRDIWRRRLALTAAYFSQPTKTLFNDIMVFFPMSATAALSSKSVTAHDVRARLLRDQSVDGASGRLQRHHPVVHAVRGTPCCRTSSTVRPSHQHLAERRTCPLAALIERPGYVSARAPGRRRVGGPSRTPSSRSRPRG